MPPRPDWVDQAHREPVDRARAHARLHGWPYPDQAREVLDHLEQVEPGPVRPRGRVNLPKLDVALVIVIVAIALIYFTAHILVAAGVGCGT